jgi:hypothetical protein
MDTRVAAQNGIAVAASAVKPMNAPKAMTPSNAQLVKW